MFGKTNTWHKWVLKCIPTRLDDNKTWDRICYDDWSGHDSIIHMHDPTRALVLMQERVTKHDQSWSPCMCVDTCHEISSIIISETIFPVIMRIKTWKTGKYEIFKYIHAKPMITWDFLHALKLHVLKIITRVPNRIRLQIHSLKLHVLECLVLSLKHQTILGFQNIFNPQGYLLRSKGLFLGCALNKWRHFSITGHLLWSTSTTSKNICDTHNQEQRLRLQWYYSWSHEFVQRYVDTCNYDHMCWLDSSRDNDTCAIIVTNKHWVCRTHTSSRHYTHIYNI